jgi:hypothetical protein
MTGISRIGEKVVPTVSTGLRGVYRPRSHEPAPLPATVRKLMDELVEAFVAAAR